jgi:hypothetical protein
MQVIYAGPDHFRELSASDLKRDSRVDKASKVTFERGVAHEVPDEVGQALLDNPGLFGSFTEAEGSRRELEKAEAEAQEVNVESEPGVDRASAPVARGARTTGRS